MSAGCCVQSFDSLIHLLPRSQPTHHMLLLLLPSPLLLPLPPLLLSLPLLLLSWLPPWRHSCWSLLFTCLVVPDGASCDATGMLSACLLTAILLGTYAVIHTLFGWALVPVPVSVHAA